MRYIFCFCLVISSYATILHPIKSIQANGNVVALSLAKDRLIVGTDAGVLEVFDIKSLKKIFEVKFPKIKDFMGDLMPPKIFSIDYDEMSQSYLAVVQAQSGARELILVHNGKQKKLIDKAQKLYISKAKFTDANRVLIALLSNEFILLDRGNLKQIYKFQVNRSRFSDFQLSKNRLYAVEGCESGVLSYIDIARGKIIKIFKGANVDNTYKVDIKNGFILGAGQDRRGSVYNIKTQGYKIFHAPFLIYAGALSPSAKLAAFAFNQNNDIVIFDVKNEKKLYTLQGHKSTLNSIVFQNEKELFSAGDEKFIQKWRLP
jgi:WD40 repeat protein